MRLQAIALLVAVLAIPPTAYAVDPDRGGGAAIPPSGGSPAPALDPTTPDPTEPTAPPLVPVDASQEPVRDAQIEEPAPPADEPAPRAAQEDDPYTEVQVPMPDAQPAPQDTGSAAVGGPGLADTGLELSLFLAAGMSMLGAGLLVLGLVRRPR